MEPLQSENCLPTLGSMLDPKFSTTNSNTAKDGVMSTQIEKLADVFNQRSSHNPLSFEILPSEFVRAHQARKQLQLFE